MNTTKSILGVLKITLGRTGRICTSSLVPLLLLLLILPVFGAQAAVVFTSLYSFTGTNDGANPGAALVQGSDGYFYGTTPYGGTTNENTYTPSGYGTVFKISTNGALTTLYLFTNGIDGANPSAALVQGSDGYFYGTTPYGGTTNENTYTPSGFGTVFKISTNGAFNTLHSFDGIDGANSSAALVQGSDGYFYGTTLIGGTNDYGTVFKISPSGALTTLYSFGTIKDLYNFNQPLDGGNPHAALVQGSDGNFYGTAFSGGSNYQFDPGFVPCSESALMGRSTLCIRSTALMAQIPLPLWCKAATAISMVLPNHTPALQYLALYSNQHQGGADPFVFLRWWQWLPA